MFGNDFTNDALFLKTFSVFEYDLLFWSLGSSHYFLGSCWSCPIFLLDRLATLRRSLFGFSREKERHRLKIMHVIHYVERLAAAIASSTASTT